MRDWAGVAHGRRSAATARRKSSAGLAAEASLLNKRLGPHSPRPPVELRGDADPLNSFRYM